MRKLNNKGVTLVELILSMAIAVILLGSITYLMSITARSYEISERQIAIQLEAQSVMNEIIDRSQEANNVLYETGPVADSITLYHLQDVTDHKTDPIEIIWLNKSTGKIYYFDKITVEERSVKLAEYATKSPEDMKNNLFGEYITDMKVAVGEVSGADRFVFDITGEKINTLEIRLTLSKRGQEYITNGKAKIRNQIYNIP